MTGRRAPLEVRFWDKVEVGGPDECWIWRASCKPFGHGEIYKDGRASAAHRVSWELHNGPIHCKNGHPFAGDNLYEFTMKNGATRRYCRKCHVETCRRLRAQAKLEEAA